MIDVFIGVAGTIGGAIIGGLIGWCASYYVSKLLIRKTHENALVLMQRQTTLIAASKFRSTIIYELTGFYPIGQYWEEKEWPRIYQSIPRVNSAAAEFRYFVTRKGDFDNAISEYNKYCRETIDITDAEEWFPSMKKEGYISKRDQFNNIVNNLLSFADEIK